MQDVGLFGINKQRQQDCRLSKEKSMIKIGIVDDHAIVRSGLRQFLSEHVDLRVEGEAGNGREAIDLVRNKEIDVLLMDLTMP